MSISASGHKPEDHGPLTFKLLLDSGWLPTLQAQHRDEPPQTEFLNGILYAASAIGMPVKTAIKQLGMSHLLINCRRRKKVAAPGGVRHPGVSVVVPVTRDWEFDANVRVAPGLQEIGAEVVVVRNAASAADAY